MNELERNLIPKPESVGIKTMTVKEVAEILGVSQRVILKHAKSMSLTENGKTTRLNELQITEIKLKIERSGRNDLAHVSKLPKTDLEKELIIQQALMFQSEKIDSLTLKNKQLQIENTRMKPKVETYDKFLNDNRLYEIGTVAKMIRGDVGRNTLKAWMRDNKIIMYNNDPYQNHKNHIRIIPEEKNGRFFNTPKFTALGVKYILDNYGLESR